MKKGECESFDEAVPIELIKQYSKLIGLDINIKLGNKAYTNSKSNFCELIQKRYPDLCKPNTYIASDSELDQEGFFICKAGLCCLKIPIVVDKIEIGLLTIGKKNILEKYDSSKNSLAQALKDFKADKRNIEFFLEKQNELEAIEESHLDSNSIILANVLRRNIEISHQRMCAEEQRIKNLKELSQNMAHQFITPIQSILGNIENLITEYKELDTKVNADILSMAFEIFDEIKKLALTADNLRDWVAIEHDIYRYEFHIGSVHHILMESIKLFRHEAKLRGIKINNPVLKDGPCPRIKISDEHIKRVFFNLLSNAVKYSFDGSSDANRHIDIYCIREGSFYCIEFVNYGGFRTTMH